MTLEDVISVICQANEKRGERRTRLKGFKREEEGRRKRRDWLAKITKELK